MHIEQASREQMRQWRERLEDRYRELGARALSLDLTRGKPGREQLDLSAALDGALAGDYLDAAGQDVRNYGGLQGLPEARALFGSILGAPSEQTLVGGNSSLTLMYQTVEFLLRRGARGPASAWANRGEVKFLCPSPGYDRHFSICEHLGIEMLPVPMRADGPDMERVEAMVRADAQIRGIWCVPRFSNPGGCVYAEDTVQRIAGLGRLAEDGFAVIWDNAYAVHELYPDAPALASISHYCDQLGTLDNVFQFGSTSKITFAGAGVGFMAGSAANLEALMDHLAFSSIGPDKVNQLRHLRFLRDRETLAAHMARHADLVRPRFEVVLEILERELGGNGMGDWTQPRGGYFISFDTRPGLARTVVDMAAAIGVKLTPAGATFPYGNDPDDTNIRLAPTYPAVDEVRSAAQAFALCVQLASVRQRDSGWED